MVIKFATECTVCGAKLKVGDKAVGTKVVGRWEFACPAHPELSSLSRKDLAKFFEAFYIYRGGLDNDDLDHEDYRLLEMVLDPAELYS